MWPDPCFDAAARKENFFPSCNHTKAASTNPPRNVNSVTHQALAEVPKPQGAEKNWIQTDRTTENKSILKKPISLYILDTQSASG